jgi:hypothetical protein
MHNGRNNNCFLVAVTTTEMLEGMTAATNITEESIGDMEESNEKPENKTFCGVAPFPLRHWSGRARALHCDSANRANFAETVETVPRTTRVYTAKQWRNSPL